MGALAVDRARRARTDRPVAPRDRSDQPRLFAIPGGAQAEPLVTRAVPLRAVPPETYAARVAVPVAEPALVPVPGGTPAPQAITVTRSLDSALLAAWAGLASGFPVACPVCDGRMAPRPAAAEGCAGGRCTDCGSTID